jgi:putative transposase
MKMLSTRPKNAFVAKGISEGRRDDLKGGGLIRSHGGWAAVKQMCRAKMFEKSDKRILGDGDFVDDFVIDF